MQQRSTMFLAFTIGSERFAIDVGAVSEIVRAVSLTRLPKAPAVIEGLIDLRGTVIPVLDIRSRFGLPAKGVDPDDHLVIARAKERVVGLRVDRAIDVMALPSQNVDDITVVVPTSEYLAGVARLPDGLILIQDLDRFLSEAEAVAVEDVVAQGLPS